ncbi:MAG: hypothetical protein PHU85_07570 [Phycisphaerae bacterium]|nr:hypothetical protein [Phycisphaerae bacterium]
MSRKMPGHLSPRQRRVLSLMLTNPRLDVLTAIEHLSPPLAPHVYRGWAEAPAFASELRAVVRFQETVLRQRANTAAYPAPAGATAARWPQTPPASPQPTAPTNEPAPNVSPFSRAEMAELMRRKPRED